MYDCFEVAVYNHLLKSDVTKDLCLFSDTPAIFNMSVPSDTHSGWNKKPHFPRITFITDWQAENDRLISGVMNVFVYATDEQIDPAILAEQIKNDLSGVFFTTQRGVFCCTWERTENFHIEGTESIINGSQLIFTILSFPDQNTYLDPDPVPGINEYVSTILDGLVIGYDELPDSFRADEPVIYVRSLSLSNAGKDTYCYRWMEYRGAVHIMCTDRTKMLQTMGKLEQQLMVDGEIVIGGDKQFLITDDSQNVTVTYGNNQLLDGQQEINGEFVITVDHPKKRYSNIYLDGELRHYVRNKTSKDG